jgi:hypothetical protein
VYNEEIYRQWEQIFTDHPTESLWNNEEMESALTVTLVTVNCYLTV